MEIEQVQRTLHELMSEANAKEKPLDHILLYGEANLSQTVYADLSAQAGFRYRRINAASFNRLGDLAAVLTNRHVRDILWIDDVERFNESVLTVLYSAMADFTLNLIIGKGAAEKRVRLNLPRFTIIATTTQITYVQRELLQQFTVALRLDA